MIKFFQTGALIGNNINDFDYIATICYNFLINYALQYAFGYREAGAGRLPLTEKPCQCLFWYLCLYRDQCQTSLKKLLLLISKTR
jgi:hypothetical protein